jgi:hypothetical protein
VRAGVRVLGVGFLVLGVVLFATGVAGASTTWTTGRYFRGQSNVVSSEVVLCSVTWAVGLVTIPKGSDSHMPTGWTGVGMVWAELCTAETFAAFPNSPWHVTTTTSGYTNDFPTVEVAYPSFTSTRTVRATVAGQWHCSATLSVCTNTTAAGYSGCVTTYPGNVKASVEAPGATGVFRPCDVNVKPIDCGTELRRTCTVNLQALVSYVTAGYNHTTPVTPVMVGPYGCMTGYDVTGSTEYKHCGVSFSKQWASVTDFLHAGGEWGFGLELGGATKFTKTVTTYQALVVRVQCGVVVTAGSRTVTLWVRYSRPSHVLAAVTFETLTGTPPVKAAQGTLASKATAPAVASGSLFKSNLRRLLAGTATKVDYVVGVSEATTGVTPAGKGAVGCSLTVTLTKAGTQHTTTPTTKAYTTTKGQTLPTQFTTTCQLTRPVTTLATCTLQNPGSWIDALNPFGGGWDPIEIVACPIGWLFVPSTCPVHNLVGMFGVTMHNPVTGVTPNAKRPATEWIGAVVQTAVEVPQAVKAGITGANTACNITKATVTSVTGGLRAQALTFCGSESSAVTYLGSNATMLKDFLTFVLAAGAIYMVYRIVTGALSGGDGGEGESE